MKSFHLILLFLFLVSFSCYQVSSSGYLKPPLRMGAWNLQRLGQTKMGKPEVVGVIVEVMRRFDIIVVLEVVDSSGEAPLALLDALNQGLVEPYNLTISERLGRTSYKEQYAFYWKSSVVNVVSTFQYDDSVQDKFQFEPFVPVFEGEFYSELYRFGFIPIHTKPSDAVSEIDALVDVYYSFRASTGIEDVIIAGDFNAGCDYVTGGNYDNIRLWTQQEFIWLISDHIDTTVKGTTCPYDRIVIIGDKMRNATYGQTAKPYYFDEEMDLTAYTFDIDDVSDHYPVEVLIRQTLGDANPTSLVPSVSLSVTVSSDDQAISTLATSVDPNQDECALSRQLVIVKWPVSGKTEVKESLTTFSQGHPDILPSEALEVLLHKLDNGGLEDSSLYGEDVDLEKYDVEVSCDRANLLCTVSLSRSVSII